MKLLSDLSRNARNCLMFEPLKAICLGMVAFYLPLYMKAVGLSEIQMGFINSFAIFLGVAVVFFCGALINRLGRKMSTLVFDIFSSAVPMLIWAFASNFWYFLIAASINTFVKISSVAWSCLMNEDTEPSKRSKIFAILNVLFPASGFFTVIMGFLFVKFGIIATMRTAYIIGAFVLILLFIARNMLVRETEVGAELMKSSSSEPFLVNIRFYLRTILDILKNRSLIFIIIIYLVSYYVTTINFFQVIYLTARLGFSTQVISFIPFANAAVNILLFAAVFRRLSRYPDEKVLLFAIIVSASGALCFILIPAGSIVILFLSVILLAVGNYFVQIYRESIFINKMGRYDKANALSAMQMFNSLLSMPSGFLGGLAYSINPVLPFVIIFILLLGIVPVAFRVSAT